MANTAVATNRSTARPSDLLAALVAEYNRTVGNSSVALQSAGLVIKAGSSALAKTGASTTEVIVNGTLVSIPASTDVAALAGTTAQNTFNVYVFSVNAAGTVATSMGTAGATLAAVVFPTIASTSAVYGYLHVNPTAAGFVGGTTALDAANTNVVYVNLVGLAYQQLIAGAVTPVLG